MGIHITNKQIRVAIEWYADSDQEQWSRLWEPAATALTFDSGQYRGEYICLSCGVTVTWRALRPGAEEMSNTLVLHTAWHMALDHATSPTGGFLGGAL